MRTVAEKVTEDRRQIQVDRAVLGGNERQQQDPETVERGEADK
jgi:hypothetical protein